jgi:hypothetical protein
MIRTVCTLILLSTFSLAQQPAPAQAPIPGSPGDLVLQGQKLSREGKQDEALALYSRARPVSQTLRGASGGGNGA